MTAKTSPDLRWTEFDGLRFFAVLGVMAVHFSPGSLAAFGPWGNLGVQFFFVLSGFLITHLLLRARGRIASGASGRATELRIFFIRRALRLWPVYFATLTATAIVNVRWSRPMFEWNALFLSNYYIVELGGWPQLFSHLWSLAVEQQFYVLWPFLILLAPRRSLPVALGILIVGGPVLRAAEVIAAGGVPPVAGVLLPFCADFFAWGAAVAMLANSRRRLSPQCLRPTFLISLAVLSVVIVAFHRGWDALYPAWHAAMAGTLTSVAAAGILIHCLAEGDSAFRRFVRWRPFVYLGTISYGIYLLHNFAHWLGPRLLRHIAGFNYFPYETAHVIYLTMLSIGMAALSWHVLEQPINRWRKTIRGSSRVAKPGAAPAPAP